MGWEKIVVFMSLWGLFMKLIRIYIIEEFIFRVRFCEVFDEIFYYSFNE